MHVQVAHRFGGAAAGDRQSADSPGDHADRAPAGLDRPVRHRLFGQRVALWITAWLLPGFDVTWLGGILGGFVFAFFNAILTGILELDEEGSFYQSASSAAPKNNPSPAPANRGAG
jgi:hypothetical protein